MDEPTGRFIDNQKRGVFQNDPRIHHRTLVQN
jgi:hypothetical protein